MIKSQGVRVLGERWYIEAEQSINNSSIVCVWGMSIGATDGYWWNKIIKWLKGVNNRQLVIFWHTKNPPNQRSILRSIRGKQEVVALLASFSNLTEAEIRTLQERIHVVFNTEKVLRISFPKKGKKTLPGSSTLSVMKEMVDELTASGQITPV